MDPQLANLQRKVARYKEVLENTNSYRQIWKENLKNEIVNQLERMIEDTGLGAKVEVRSEIENLEAVFVTLGQSQSGLFQQVGEDIQRHMIKQNGTLIYQQLFNGKIIVLINYPYIENYGNPRPPKTIAIYRPEELKEAFYIRHLEEFITEITNWEDFDDDEPTKRIGFDFNFGAVQGIQQDGNEDQQ